LVVEDHNSDGAQRFISISQTVLIFSPSVRCPFRPFHPFSPFALPSCPLSSILPLSLFLTHQGQKLTRLTAFDGALNWKSVAKNICTLYPTWMLCPLKNADISEIKKIEENHPQAIFLLILKF
jgi:hypothetical protein